MCRIAIAVSLKKLQQPLLIKKGSGHPKEGCRLVIARHNKSSPLYHLLCHQMSPHKGSYSCSVGFALSSFSRSIHKRCFHLPKFLWKQEAVWDLQSWRGYTGPRSSLRLLLPAHSRQQHKALARACLRVSGIFPWNPTGSISCLAWSNPIGLSSLQRAAATENCSDLCSCLESSLTRRSYCSAPFFLFSFATVMSSVAHTSSLCYDL